MKNHMFSSFSIFFAILFISIVLSLCIFIPSLSEYGSISTYIPNSYINSSTNFNIGDSSFIWPTPGYTTITSSFGPRKSPTTGKQSFHYGTDIGVPQGTRIISISSGIVSFTGFNGANGYTVTIKSGNLNISYSHVSPNFIVFVGQNISKGEYIANVGPKNVYGVPNNPYKDNNGNPTNRINYWSTFTFKYKKRRQSRQSIRLFLKI